VILKKFPTEIEFLDKKIGGFYPGLVLLHEMVGAGGREFALTYLSNYSEKENKLYYISIAKTETVVLREINLIFQESTANKLKEALTIESLAEFYFKDSIVPMHWISGRSMSIQELRNRGDLLTTLAEILEKTKNESIVFLDSITDILRIANEEMDWNDFISLIKGIKNLCIRKDILLISVITAGTVCHEKEQEVLEQGDGVLVFEWSIDDDSIKRWLYFRKYLGILPLLEKEGIIKFNVKIDPNIGFTTSKLVRMI